MYFGIGHESQYVFTPEGMHAIAKQAIDEGRGDINKTIQIVVSRLKDENPKWVLVFIFTHADVFLYAFLVEPVLVSCDFPVEVVLRCFVNLKFFKKGESLSMHGIECGIQFID